MKPTQHSETRNTGLANDVFAFTGPQATDWLLAAYQRLEETYGDLHWWPAQTPEEMVIGAILVQNVSWKNTERALANLAAHHLLNFEQIATAELEEIASLIIPTRFYNMKAKRLKAFAAHLKDHHGGRLTSLYNQPMDPLRQELLSIPGIGPETADDIVLYGAGCPSFVIDTYTKRILHRCGLIPEQIPYEELRDWFMQHLPHDTRLFNQFHALMDRTGNRCCTAKQPKCDKCPLQTFCAFAKINPVASAPAHVGTD